MKVLLLIATSLPLITSDFVKGVPKPYTAHLTDGDVVFAVRNLNILLRKSGDLRRRTAVNIGSATTQLVAGTLNRFVIEVVGGDTNELCSITIFSQIWLAASKRFKIVGSPKCVPKKREVKIVPGGEFAVSMTDHDVVMAVASLEIKVNDKSNSAFYLKIKTVGAVTKQVVAGYNIRFYDTVFAQSSCTKSAIKSNPSKVCTISDDASAELLCNFELQYNLVSRLPFSISSNSCPFINDIIYTVTSS